MVDMVGANVVASATVMACVGHALTHAGCKPFVESVDAKGAFLRDLKLIVPEDSSVWACGNNLFLSFALHRVNDHYPIRAHVQGAARRGFDAGRIIALHARLGYVAEFD